MTASPRARFSRASLAVALAMALPVLAVACGSEGRPVSPTRAVEATAAQEEIPAPSPVPATPAQAQATAAAATPEPTPSPSPTHPPPTPAQRRGGVLKVAQGADPTSCDLHTARASGYVSVHACNPMLSQIVRTPASDYGLIEPDIALGWSGSPQGPGMQWVFKLREGLKWHDGTPVTSEDLKFSLDRIMAPPKSLQIGRAGAVARYVSKPEQVTTGPDVLVVFTDYQAASFLPALASVYVSMYPKAAVEKMAPPSPVAFMSVVGSGPFKVKGAVRGTSYTMTRFDGYYEAGLPYLDEVQFLIMPEPAVRMAALRSHAIDVIAIVTDPEAAAIEKDFKGKITVYASPSAGGNTVQMNLSRPPFNNPKVRRAVNLAISRQEAEQALGPGLRGAIMPPGGPWALPPEQLKELPGYKLAQPQGTGAAQAFPDPVFEREEARRLLAEAGFSSGFGVKMHVRADPFAQTLAEFAAGQLGQVGIGAEVVPVEPGAYQDMVVKRDFAMIAHSHSFALDDPDAVLFDQYSCNGSENYPGLCDPAVEDLLARQSRELDPARRKALVDDIQRRVWEADAKVWSQWTIRRTPVWGNIHGMKPGGPSLYQGRRLEMVWTGQ